MVEINNGGTPLSIEQIPERSYSEFYTIIDSRLRNTAIHCVSYSAIPIGDSIRCFCCLADDSTHKLYITSYRLKRSEQAPIPSLTAKYHAMHCYERELHENWGIKFSDHPWLKPIRYSASRYDRQQTIENYPFYSISSDELHEVGVGPIHAGIIEPGYFRFICNGEKVLHLEIVLGYQHRGVERLMLDKKSGLQRSILAESIAGDTAIGHSLAYAMCVESLNNVTIPERLQLERTIALELERIAIHIGDTGALCMDIAYQLGQVTCEALRTIVINTTQLWCGNRFGKGLIRPCGTNYPLNNDTAAQVLKNLEEVEYRYNQVAERIFTLPSVLSRFEEVGTLTAIQAGMTGIVGLAARASGVSRDIRQSHPFQYYKHVNFSSIILETGDVQARALMRRYEVEQSIQLVKLLLKKHDTLNDTDLPSPDYKVAMKPNSLTISLVEGWRGEICHTAITNSNGELALYKVKDPSFHNWMGLALAVRNQEISDFPICNKSFNLSYCGHDL